MPLKGLSVPTGSAEASVLQQGSCQVAAAYALYSSALMLVVTTGKGVHGFTLDPESQTFYLTHDIEIPRRGESLDPAISQSKDFS